MRKFVSKEIKEFVSEPKFDEKIILNKNLLWPKISIITPSYNQEKFLEETILSVLNQNYPNLEYIIIDGGSKDGSVEIIKKYKKFLYYWISEPDQGQANALNKGFRLSTGDLIGWQNSDDVYLPGSFLKVAHVFLLQFADLYFGNSYNIDMEKNIIKPMVYTKYNLKSNIYEGIQLANQSAFWRRELFDRIGYIDESFHYMLDVEFFLRCGLKRCKFFFINEFLGCLRIHEMTKSSSNTQKWIEERFSLAAKYRIHRDFERVNRILSFLHRAYKHIILGHFEYILKGLFRRMKNLFRQ